MIGTEDSDRLYTVQLEKKFGTPTLTYVPDSAQRLTKKKTLTSQQDKNTESVNKPDQDPNISDANNVNKDSEVKIGGYYNPELLPDYLPNDFDLKKDKLVQHNVIDVDGKLIPCWDNFNKLRPGTLVLCIVSLHVWNIANRDGRFKRFYTLNAHSVRVLKESPMPPTTAIKSLPCDTSPSDAAETISAQEEFDSFSTKKRMKTRTENIPQASSSKNTDKRIKKPSKAPDIQMDIGL